MKCKYCENETFYTLKNGYLKCKVCKRKFSPKKIEKELNILECFCKGLNALECSNKTSLNYLTVKKRYDLFRKKIALFCEENFQGKEVIEYDEYIYLEKSKKKEQSKIFDAVDFLTFHYENKIYNLLLPSLNKYKNELLSDGIDQAYYKEFSNFMMFNKISKLQKRENLIVKFWNFFENEIVKYKGVKRENFFYYLKECEFRFNYDEKSRFEIIKGLI
ncbi:MAG: transposase [Epsilonproteobacteria bacterium]|nr:transposase [Campylobacterota bacterium]